MSSPFLERAQVLFSEGRIRAALAIFGETLPEDPGLALSCAAALSEIGRPQDALAAAKDVQARNASNPIVVARAQTVIGAVQIEWGSSAEGLSALTSAFALAESAGAHAEAAKAALRIFSAVHSASGRAESTAYLRRAAFSVLRASRPRLLAELYCRVGQADAQDGQLQTARHHLGMAVDILQEHPEFLLLARTKLTLSSALALSFRNDSAVKQAREALEAAEIAGSLGMTRRCRSNVAQLQYRTGLVESARRNARALLTATDLAPRFRLAVLETYVAAQLELGACSKSDPEVVEFLDVMAKQEDPTWTSVEAIPTQARVLELLEGYPSALLALETGQARSEQRQHHESTYRLLLLQAELALRHGLTEEGESLAWQATVRAGTRPSVEFTALLERVRGLAAAKRGLRGISRSHLRRSERLYRGCGLRTEARRTRQVRREHLPTGRSPQSPDARAGLMLGAASDVLVLEALAVFPHAVAGELTHIIGEQRLGEPTTLLGPVVPGADADRLVIHCGVDGETELNVVVRPSTNFYARQRLSLLSAAVASGARLAEAAMRAAPSPLAQLLELVPEEGARGLYLSPAMRSILAQVRRVAKTDLPVLLMGETGTGKEVLAQEIHAMSRRSHQPFIAVNVSAMPREMLEGLLFGYRRGAFTGAVGDAKGLIREAEGGTLFIDEIGELSPELQPKLLRFLESGEIQPLGERPQHVDVRIVAATNARLEQLVREGKFRDDLFYRLNVVSLTIPPLRERREEIPTLINHFLTRHARAAGKSVPQVTPQVLERLSSYPWPGNVRQLTNELKRIVALHDENELVDLKYLSEPLRTAEDAAPPLPPGADATRVTIHLDQSLQAMYDDLERAAIPRAMKLEQNNQTETARRLGITRKGLYLKRRRLGLQDDE